MELKVHFVVSPPKRLHRLHQALALRRVSTLEFGTFNEHLHSPLPPISTACPLLSLSLSLSLSLFLSHSSRPRG